MGYLPRKKENMKIKDLLKEYDGDTLVQFEFYQFNGVYNAWETALLDTYKLSELLSDTTQNDSIYPGVKKLLDSNIVDYFSEDNSSNLTIGFDKTLEYFNKEVKGIKITKYEE